MSEQEYVMAALAAAVVVSLVCWVWAITRRQRELERWATAHGLRVAPTAEGWTAAVTLDV